MLKKVFFFAGILFFSLNVYAKTSDFDKYFKVDMYIELPDIKEYIKKIIKHSGIVFLIVRFSTLNKDYILKGEDLITFIDNNDRMKMDVAPRAPMPRANFIETNKILGR